MNLHYLSIIFDFLLFRSANLTNNTIGTDILNKTFRTYEPYCSRHSYIRGLGHPLDTCPEPSLEQDGLLCYPPCRSGYNGVGPICWQKCGNMTAIGFVCWDSRLSERSCPWYGNCGRIYLRDNYNRGIGLPRICSKPYEQNGAFCYEKCNTNYHGVGPVCWQDCPTSHPYSCLAGCSRTREICQRKIIDMLRSVIDSSITLWNFMINIPLISLKIIDILSNVVKGDWILVEKDVSMIVGELADNILPDLAKKFLYWSYGSMESTTTMTDKHVSIPFLKYFRFDSIDIAFTYGKCDFFD